MHTKHITHRDLKLHNIMICNYETDDERDLRVLVIDFGLSKFYKKEDEDLRLKSFIGTEMYMAPEIAKNFAT